MTKITLLEHIRAMGTYGIPWYLRLWAPFDHYYRVWFHGHIPVDVLSFELAHETPGYGPPRCAICDGIVGKCGHDA